MLKLTKKRNKKNYLMEIDLEKKMLWRREGKMPCAARVLVYGVLGVSGLGLC